MCLWSQNVEKFRSVALSSFLFQLVQESVVACFNCDLKLRTHFLTAKLFFQQYSEEGRILEENHSL